MIRNMNGFEVLSLIKINVTSKGAYILAHFRATLDFSLVDLFAITA